MKKSLLFISALCIYASNTFAQLCQIGLSSAVGSDTQNVCKNTAITNITYSVTGTGAGVTSLPSGLTGSYNANVFTISGTPTVIGAFNYTVTTSGSTCTNSSKNGIITVVDTTKLTLT